MHLLARALATECSCHGLRRRIAVDEVARCTRRPKVEKGCSGAHDAFVFVNPRRLAAKLHLSVWRTVHLIKEIR